MSAAVKLSTETSISLHASKRMAQRGLSAEQVDLVLIYGRKVRARGAVFYVVGKKEIARLGDKMSELIALEGIQVVVNTDDEVVMTVYRNHDFRQIRPGKRRERKLM
jgi:tyrosine-protein phosphatase YwqE